VNEDKEGNFEDESLGCDGVNLFGKAGSELAEGGFNGFAKVLKQKGFVRRVGQGTIALAGGPLPIAGRFGEQVFPAVVGVASSRWASFILFNYIIMHTKPPILKGEGTPKPYHNAATSPFFWKEKA